MRSTTSQGTRIGRRPRGWGAVLAFTMLLLVRGAATAEEDHLIGFKAKDTAQIAAPATVTVNSPLISGTCQLKKAKYMLLQAEKNGGDDARGGPAGDFICYKAICPNPVSNIDADTQFGPVIMDPKKSQILCLPADLPASTCSGQLVGGYCWYLGAVREDCDTTCANEGLTCDPATVSYAGSDGTLANCNAVLEALVGGPVVTSDTMIDDGVGCYYQLGNGARDIAGTTDCGNFGTSTVQRACACQ